MTATRAEQDTDFAPVYHRYGPHRAGLPPLVPYGRELLRRHAFAAEMSRATLRGRNVNTFFGQAWLVLNPLLLAGVYYLLVTIIRARHDPLLFAHLTLTLFAFNLVSTAITTGASSVVGAGRLVINTAFPRLLIPLSAVRTAFFQFLPTVPIYLILHAVFLTREWHPRQLLATYFLVCMVVFSMGLAALFATLQVYFRDTGSFLPYFVRLWMYLSPVLWMPAMLDGLDRVVQAMVEANPMYSMLVGYADLIQGGRMPAGHTWGLSAAWALVVLVLGCLFFVSREREFAVRLT